MRRYISAIAAVVLVTWATTAEARGLTNLTSNYPAAGKSLVDSIPFRNEGNASNICTLLGAADRDTTMGLTPLYGLKTWAVHWLVTNAAGPSTNTTWALNCTLEVSLDSVNWEPVQPSGTGVWAITTSTDETKYMAMYNFDFPDSTVTAPANNAGTHRLISTARYGRFTFKVANSADDTVYVVGIQSRTYNSP